MTHLVCKYFCGHRVFFFWSWSKEDWKKREALNWCEQNDLCTDRRVPGWGLFFHLTYCQPVLRHRNVLFLHFNFPLSKDSSHWQACFPEPCWRSRNLEMMYFSRKKEWKCEFFYDLFWVLAVDLLLKQGHQCVAIEEAALLCLYLTPDKCTDLRLLLCGVKVVYSCVLLTESIVQETWKWHLRFVRRTPCRPLL